MVSVTETAIGPDPAYPPAMGVARPFSVSRQTPCGMEYQEGAGRQGGETCNCGRFAIGRCVECGVYTCGEHSRLVDGRNLCLSDVELAKSTAANEAGERIVSKIEGYLAEVSAVASTLSDPMEHSVLAYLTTLESAATAHGEVSKLESSGRLGPIEAQSVADRIRMLNRAFAKRLAADPHRALSTEGNGQWFVESEPLMKWAVTRATNTPMTVEIQEWKRRSLGRSRYERLGTLRAWELSRSSSYEPGGSGVGQGGGTRITVELVADDGNIYKRGGYDKIDLSFVTPPAERRIVQDDVARIADVCGLPKPPPLGD